MVALGRHALRRCLSAASGAPGWRTAALEGRSVLRLEGADVYTFLQARAQRALPPLPPPVRAGGRGAELTRAPPYRAW